jgi:hypothetical protein
MQNLIKRLRSPTLRADDSSAPPTATCLMAANWIEKLNEMGRADLAARQLAEHKLVSVYQELEALRDKLRAYENRTTDNHNTRRNPDVAATYSANDGSGSTQPTVDDQA